MQEDEKKERMDMGWELAGNTDTVKREICLEWSEAFRKTLLQMDLHNWQDTVTLPTVAFNFAVTWLKFIVLKSHCVGVMGRDKELGSSHSRDVD